MTLNKDDIEKNQEYKSGRIWAGLIVILVGGVLLAKQMGVIIPEWVLTWQTLLIVIGFYIGVKNRFRHPTWWILTIVGAVFLADEFIEGWSIGQYFWPIFIIAAGLGMIFGRRNKNCRHSDWKNKRYSDYNYASTTDDYIESVAIFGGIKKNIISKDFKGGEVVCVFSGAEINLTQAVINGTITLELVNIMGGTKLIIPSDWEIKSEIVAIFGGIDDKRMQQTVIPSGEKVLLIRGTSVFGGIEIKSI